LDRGVGQRSLVRNCYAQHLFSLYLVDGSDGVALCDIVTRMST
jgi:hypothetical protein